MTIQNIPSSIVKQILNAALEIEKEFSMKMDLVNKKIESHV